MFSRKIYPSWMERNQKRKMAQIIEIYPEVKYKDRILDIGSGPGFLEEILPNAIALDIDLENLKKVKGRNKVLASGDFLPFKSNCIDVVFCIDSVHLLKSTCEIERVLRGSGLAIITIFCSEYNKKERLNYLKKLVSNLEIEREFIVEGESELDAVIFSRKKYMQS
ncbi:MAG: class I SAM-dependent methyltransferase [Methanocellales archaeon]